MLKSYRFSAKEKDPVIGIAQTCVEIFASRHNLPFTRAMHVIAKESGVSYACLNNWFYGGTRLPYFDTVFRVVHATGREIKIGNHDLGSKPRFKVAA